MNHILHLVEDAAQAAALESAFRELAPQLHVTTCGTPLQLRERFAACRPCHGVIVDDRVAGGALAPLVRHLRAEDPRVPLVLVTDLEGDAAAARRALAGVDHAVSRDGGVAVIPTLLSEMQDAGDPGPARLRALVAGGGTVLPPVMAGCRRAEFTSVALDAAEPGASADGPMWSAAEALVLVSSSTGEQAAVALQRFRRLQPAMPVVVVAEERYREGFLRLDAFDCVPPSAGAERLEDALERAARVRRVLVENTQLRAREARLKSIVENLPGGVVLTTADGVVLAANVAALSLLGLHAAAQAVGRPITSFVSLDAGEGTADLPRLAAGDSPATVHMEARQPAGRRLVAQVTAHQRDEATAALLIVLREDGAAPARETPGPDSRAEELARELEIEREARARAEEAWARLRQDAADAHDQLERERQSRLEAHGGGEDERVRLAAALDELRAQLADVTARRATLEEWNAELDALRARDQATLAALRADLDAARQAAATAPVAPRADEPAPASAPEREPAAAVAIPESDATRWAFEAAGVGVVVTTESGEILACSDAAARLCGNNDATTIGAGARLPDALLSSGMPPTGVADEPHRFEVCFQGPDGLLRWVLGSTRWQQPETSSSPTLEWLLVDRSEHRRGAQRSRFLRQMEGVRHVLSSAATECTTLLRESTSGREAPPSGVSQEPVEGASAQAALQRVDALLKQLARFAQTRARRPVVLQVNAVLESLGPMLSWLAGEDSSCDIGRAADDLRVHADPADLEDVLAKMVMAGRDCLPAGGALAVRAGATRVEVEEGGVPLHRTQAELTMVAVGFDCAPMTVPPALAETVVRLGGRVAASHEPGRSARLSVLLEPVLGAAAQVTAGDAVPSPAVTG